MINEALARGFLSVRRAARALIEERGWDATEEAVVSAIRRYEPSPCVDLENVFHLLGRTRKTAATGLGMVHVPQTREFVTKMADIRAKIGLEETLGFIPDSEVLTVLVDDWNVGTVAEIFRRDGGNEEKIRTDRGLGKIELRFPEKSPVNASALAVVLYYLGHRHVEILDVFCTFPTCSIYVREADFADAFELTKELQTRQQG